MVMCRWQVIIILFFIHPFLCRGTFLMLKCKQIGMNESETFLNTQMDFRVTFSIPYRSWLTVLSRAYIAGVL